MRTVADAEALAEMVARLFANPAEAERMGRRGADLAGRLADLGMVGVAGTPDALAATIRDSVTATGRIVKQLGIQPQ